ncbi:MAG: twin-arginine translocase subunit TatC [Candidatus Omnitrophota bacterium]
MNDLYPEEPKKLNVIGHLEEMRRRILFYLAFLVLAAVAAFSQIGVLMAVVKAPVRGFIGEMIFISPSEPFVACLKMAFLAGFIVCFPLMIYHAWAFLAPAFPEKARKRVILWISLALTLFFLGISFSYFLAIPAALKFLIGFGRGIAIPNVTLGKYISFFVALILAGGLVFEIPVVIGLFVDAGLLDTGTLRQKRHYALLIILIAAAIITPTQDIVNMLLFAIPMMLLYEIGILIAAQIERQKAGSKTPQ